MIPSFDDPDAALLARAADLRARGFGWEGAARQLGLDADDLRDRCAARPDYPGRLRAAHRGTAFEA
ncbi:MAG TPA: hypothetical protein VM529_10065, partial [Gemmata sp.]|nr:hypothetical protein [Gemmata sp.]